MFIRVTAAVMAAMLLCSCAAQGGKTSGVSGQENADNAFPAEKLKTGVSEQLDEIRSAGYDNITISEDFVLAVPDLDKLGVYDVVYPKNYDEGALPLLEKYIPGFDRGKVISNKPEGGVGSTRYEDDEKDFALITSIGGFVFSDRSSLNKVFYGTETGFLETVPAWGDPARELELGSSTTTLGEVVKSSEEAISGFIGAAGRNCGLEPFAFSTQRLEDGSIAGIMHCRSIYKGVPVFDTMSVGSGEYSEPIACSGLSTVTFTEGSTVGQLSVFCDYEDFKCVRKLDSLISPAEAVRLISEKLAGRISFEAVREELVYFPTCTESLDGTEPGGGNDPGDIIRLTPYWVLYDRLDWWHEVLAAVNCVTGEVEYIVNV